MYVFNKITVKPQLPKSINRLDEIANNLWWSWNSEYLRLLKKIDRDLWETVEKNPVKFLKRNCLWLLFLVFLVKHVLEI